MRNLNKSPVLLNTVDMSSIESTTTIYGNRSRYSSGIFLSQIHSSQSPEKSGELSYIEFVVRATRRNKAGNCANNADCSKAVVEPLPHPIQVQAVSFTSKLTRTLEMIFKFLLTGKKRLTIRIRANSEQEARQQLNLSPNALCVARLPVQGGIYA